MSIGIAQTVRLRLHPLVGAITATFMVAGVLLTPVVLLDGPMGLFGVLLLPDTEYAPDFSSWAFLKVRQGMSATEVRALLGEPLRVIASEKPREQTWCYSRSPHDTHFRCRVVSFKDSVVSKIHSEFYVD